jgi:hypothetical protein
MTFRYLIYRTDYGNTIVRESSTNTATGGTEQALFTNFFIPTIQPLYYWKVITISSTVVPNSETNIKLWLATITPAPTSNEFATIGQLTGVTVTLNNDINYISGVTDTKLNKSIYSTFTATTGLQQITQINAITNIESEFSNGLITNKIRPISNSTSAITINKANGITPIITIDTISGFTGFGTTHPKSLVHVYGNDNSNAGDLWGLQNNRITIDGISDGDKDIIWAENGIPKWDAQIYRGEQGKFWYLYNPNGQLNVITTSESGRVGINARTNILDYHMATLSGNSIGVVRVNGAYDKNYITVYDIQINSISGTPNTFIWRLSKDLGNSFEDWSSPSGCTTGSTLINSGVEISFEFVTGFTVGDFWRDRKSVV